MGLPKPSAATVVWTMARGRHEGVTGLADQGLGQLVVSDEMPLRPGLEPTGADEVDLLVIERHQTGDRRGLSQGRGVAPDQVGVNRVAGTH